MLEKNEAIVSNRQYKYVVTFALYICYFIYAMNFCIIGPSMLDLRKIYKTSFPVISNINTVRSVAYTFGALNGLAFQYFNRHLLFMFLLLITSITMALTPVLPSMSLLFVNFAINGFVSAGIESVSDVWILEMWEQECGPFVQALHFTFGIGSIATTLIVEPFLSESVYVKAHFENSDKNEFSKTDYLNQTLFPFLPQSLSNETMLKEEVFHSRIFIPYSFGAMAIALNAFIFCGLYCYEKYIPSLKYTRVPEILEEKDLTHLERINNLLKTQLMPTKPILMLIVLSGLLLSTSGILEGTQLTYFPAFAHFSNSNISEKKAAFMLTGLTIAFTIGRAIAIPLSHFLKPKQMIFGSLVILSIANYQYLNFANNSESLMWFANINFGLGVSSLIGSIYAMLEEQTSVNNLIGALFTFMGGLSGTVYPLIMGYYIEAQPLVLVYFNIIMTFISFFLLISIHLMILKYIR